MTHDELVSRAEHWLKNSLYCHIIFKETSTWYSNEAPDAIGWARGGTFSVLIECKASLSDFCSDKKKRSRRIYGMGNYRYFLCPANLIDPSRHAVPKGWGLLWAYQSQIRKKVEAHFRPANTMQLRAELSLFYSKLRYYMDDSFIKK